MIKYLEFMKLSVCKCPSVWLDVSWKLCTTKNALTKGSIDNFSM